MEQNVTVIKNRSFDYERALYESNGVELIGCRFEGEADGESALKESCHVVALDCLFDLRYPFWHDADVTISHCEMTVKCRAPLWYTRDVKIENSKIHGTKAIRECEGVRVEKCEIKSDELGWDCRDITVLDSLASGEYMMSRTKNIYAENFKMQGKYSFQYVENANFDSCVLDTKDAFWHAKNVTVKNSVINGEYLGWYSENLTLENCVIKGTQPLCYCKGLKLISCEMHECDLAFEKSTVEAEIITPVISIKNVLSGEITVPCVDEIICDGEKYQGKIIVKN